jgi:thiamine-monophosphate kinase
MRNNNKKMDKESFLISLFKNDFIGDDGAVVGEWVYSKDLFCEDIHFKKEWMSLKEIAKKAMLVNISDAIVMNAKPKYALLGLKLPFSITEKEIQELSEGFLEITKNYGITIIGGDTVSGNKIDISITLVSHSTNPISRRGLKQGDLLLFTGNLGGVKKDLERLLNGKKIDKNSRFITPILRDKFFYEIAPYVKVAMDISDGLSKDISRLSKINQIGFKFLKELSFDELCSGEEYEIVFGCSKENLDIIVDIAKQHRVTLTTFAKVISGSYENICGENHFG